MLLIIFSLVFFTSMGGFRVINVDMFFRFFFDCVLHFLSFSACATPERGQPGVLLAEFSYDAGSGLFRFERASSPWLTLADEADKLFEVLEVCTHRVRDRDMLALVCGGQLPSHLEDRSGKRRPATESGEEQPSTKRPHV